MTYKEWNAIVTIAGGVVVGAWVAWQAISDPAAGVSEVAARLLWAILFTIIFDIVAIILVTILVSAASRKEFKDERSDERDLSVGARGMRNAYLVASITGLASLFALAFGLDPATAAYVLFGGLMLAGISDSASRLFYYRLG